MYLQTLRLLKFGAVCFRLGEGVLFSTERKKDEYLYAPQPDWGPVGWILFVFGVDINCASSVLAQEDAVL